MNNKFFQGILKPYFRVTMGVAILLTVLLLFCNLYLGIFSCLVTIALFFYCKSYVGIRSSDLRKYSGSLLREVDETSRMFLSKDPRPLCMIDHDGTILWCNEKFETLYESAEALRNNITQITGLKVQDIEFQANTNEYNIIEHGGRTYRTQVYSGGHTCLIYWTDVTTLETLKTMYNDERLCYVLLDVDNYDEILNKSDDETRALLVAEIETTIRQWAAPFNPTILKPRSYRYVILLEQKDYAKMEEKHFSILDEVRAIETSSDFPLSVSIGAGIGGRSIEEAETFANAALDLALGRGGDQAVVKKRSNIEYYGGKMETVEKRNKGRSRIMAHALRQLIEQSDKVFVMGHKDPDMDSFGACEGIVAFARAVDKDAAIVIGKYNKSLTPLVDRAREAGTVLLTGDEACHDATADSLLVVVDANRPQLLECPDLLPITDKLVLIDHHRKSEDSLDDVTLNYLETYASSAAELVTEILEYGPDDRKILEKHEAEALLAGIALDTKNFSVKTGVRTFEAASWLRRNGADTVAVRKLFQSTFRDARIRSAIVASAELLGDGIALSSCPLTGPEVRVIMSQAADQLLTVEGVKASIVVGKGDEGHCTVSARSLGQINVQTIMEKLGGGGHLTMAGAQPEGTEAEVMQKIRAIITETEE